jgi:glycosyltransferase involved in cell wall biosynthesis
MMRIAFVCPYFSGPDLDAVTTSFYESMINVQKKAGHELTVFCLTDGEASEEIIDGIRYVRKRFDIERYAPLHNVRFSPVLAWSAARAMDLYRQCGSSISADSFDLIECVKATDALGWLAHSDLPVLLTSVTPQFELMSKDFDRQYTQFDKSIVSALEICAANACSLIAAPSLQVQNLFHSVCGLPKHKVVPYLVPFQNESAERLDSPADPSIFRIAYTGGIERYKGVDLLIECLPQLEKNVPNFHLTISGETVPLLGNKSLEAELRLRVRELGIAEKVSFLPASSRSERRRLHADSDVIVFPFRYCGCMAHILEAMSDGAAIVASSVGSIQEQLSHGSDVHLVPSGEPVSLADAFSQLAAQPDYRKRLAQGAVEFIARTYSGETLIRQFDELARTAVTGFDTERAKPFKLLLSQTMSGLEDFCTARYMDKAAEETYAAAAEAGWQSGYQARVEARSQNGTLVSRVKNLLRKQP